MNVEIPKALIEKLEALGPHFCMVYSQYKKHSDPTQDWKKRPVGDDWNKPENLMHASNPKLQQWLREGGNYGVVGGFGLAILDADTQEIKRLILERLPRTFTVQSPGSSGWHCYFLCGLEKAIRLRDKDGENVGDIQGPGKMVVGPGSIHPNGAIYKIVNDAPLAQITREQLEVALGDFVVPEKEFVQVEETARRERQRLGVNLDITQVVLTAGLRKQAGELYGPHPVHGSKTGRNFWINPSKNVWHCFRHGTGGGPLSYLAVEEGIIRCEDATPSGLRGDLFKQVLRKAVERGLVEERSKAQKKKLRLP